MKSVIHNVYDNQDFFDGYKKLRDNDVNANELVEKPALFSLLPDLTGKTILDLGCGFGDHCIEYKKMGASKVVGIDISEKMIEVASKENSGENIEYIIMSMNDIDQLDMKFDIVCSSLAFHYVENLNYLINRIHSILNDNGLLIFSQENPLTSTYQDSSGPRWEKDQKGNKIASRLSDYSVESKRESTWFSTKITKYHRTFSTIINTLIDSGFIIKKLLEPIPNQTEMEKYPDYKDNYHRPDFLLVKVEKYT